MLTGLWEILHILLGITILNSHQVASGMCLQNDHILDLKSLGTLYLKEIPWQQKQNKTCTWDKNVESEVGITARTWTQRRGPRQGKAQEGSGQLGGMAMMRSVQKCRATAVKQ